MVQWLRLHLPRSHMSQSQKQNKTKTKKTQQSSSATNSIKILSFPHQKNKKCTPLEENKVKVRVVIRVTEPQAKECWQPTEAASSKEWTFP